MARKPKLRSIFVEAREWFDKVNGNTYFSARVFVNGKLEGYLPLQLGYESQFEYEATKWLLDNGFIRERIAPLWRLREDGVDVYTVKYSAGYRDTKRFGSIDA
jgi:hypothetical protein